PVMPTGSSGMVDGTILAPADAGEYERVEGALAGASVGAGASVPVGVDAVSTARPAGAVFIPAAEDVRHETWLLDDPTISSHALIRAEMEDVIATEGPILVDRLVRVVAARFDLHRVRASRRDSMLRFAPGDL